MKSDDLHACILYYVRIYWVRTICRCITMGCMYIGKCTQVCVCVPMFARYCGQRGAQLCGARTVREWKWWKSIAGGRWVVAKRKKKKERRALLLLLFNACTHGLLRHLAGSTILVRLLGQRIFCVCIGSNLGQHSTLCTVVDETPELWRNGQTAFWLPKSVWIYRTFFLTEGHRK